MCLITPNTILEIVTLNNSQKNVSVIYSWIKHLPGMITFLANLLDILLSL